MKVLLLVSLKLGDGKVIGKGTILSEPFPPEIQQELAVPSKVPIVKVIEEPAALGAKVEEKVAVQDNPEPITPSKSRIKRR